MAKLTTNAKKISLMDYSLKRLSNCLNDNKPDLIQDAFINLFLRKNGTLFATQAEVAVAMRRMFGFDSVIIAHTLAKLHSGESCKSIETLKSRILEHRLSSPKKRPGYLKTIANNRG